MIFHHFPINIAEKLLICLTMLAFYYIICKSIIINKIAPYIAKQCQFTKKYSVERSKGILELPIIAVSHVLFVILLMAIFSIHLNDIGLFKGSWSQAILGAFIGLGCMGISTLLCQFYVYLLHTLPLNNKPENLESWLAVSRGGWLRHHIHVIETLPLWLVLLTIILQVSSEEIIFRGILIHYFSTYGPLLSIAIPLILFIIMQASFMPSTMNAMFPMIGATVMGIVHSLLYLHASLLMPLIIAHITFFLFHIFISAKERRP